LFVCLPYLIRGSGSAIRLHNPKDALSHHLRIFFLYVLSITSNFLVHLLTRRTASIICNLGSHIHTFLAILLCIILISPSSIASSSYIPRHDPIGRYLHQLLTCFLGVYTEGLRALLWPHIACYGNHCSSTANTFGTYTIGFTSSSSFDAYP
jgi:hypothetical protein